MFNNRRKKYIPAFPKNRPDIVRQEEFQEDGSKIIKVVKKYPTPPKLTRDTYRLSVLLKSGSETLKPVSTVIYDKATLADQIAINDKISE